MRCWHLVLVFLVGGLFSCEPKHKAVLVDSGELITKHQLVINSKTGVEAGFRKIADSTSDKKKFSAQFERNESANSDGGEKDYLNVEIELFNTHRNAGLQYKLIQTRSRKQMRALYKRLDEIGLGGFEVSSPPYRVCFLRRNCVVLVSAENKLINARELAESIDERIVSLP